MEYDVDYLQSKNKNRSKKITVKDKFIGRELKKLRNVYRDENGTIRKLRAFELAEMVGYQQSTISNFENGNKRIPEKLIPELEKIFKLPTGYFNSKFLEKNGGIDYVKASEEDQNIYEKEILTNKLSNEIEECLDSIEMKSIDDIREKLIKSKEIIEKIKIK